jgi:hypothetical protein
VKPYVLADMQDGYVELVDYVMARGQEVSPRGMKTLEIRDASFTLADPRLAIPVGVGRKPKLEIGAAEAAQLIGGVSDAKMMVNAAKNFEMFVEHDRLYGAYGPRIYQQVPSVIRAITKDPDTRQAGLVVARPDDTSVPSKDVPCTLQLRYALRDQLLHASTVMRSNDCVWGVTYDLWMFTALQQAIAYALGVKVGTYTHHATSLHVYVERDAEIIAGLHPYDGAPHPPAPVREADGMLRTTQVALQRWAWLGRIPRGRGARRSLVPREARSLLLEPPHVPVLSVLAA